MYDNTVEKDYSEELEVGTGHFRVVSFTRVSSLVSDSNYGADADGRRGMAVTFIDEDDIENVYVGARKLDTYPEKWQAMVRSAIWNFLKDEDVDDSSF